MTICKDCIHHRGTSDIWYDNFCLASERKSAIDPVTGVKGYAGKNDLGTEYISDQQYDYCRAVNKGSCIMFEAKAQPSDS